jgi:uncharacterized membrane protein YebE (DUF533 family)
MDTKRLLEQFLGPDTLASLGGQQQGGRDMARAAAPREQLLGNLGAPGAALGGLAAGGLLGMFLGKKKMRKMAKGAVGYGGAAVLGALAHRAYQNWQSGQSVAQAPAATTADLPQTPAAITVPMAADGKPFALAVIQAMIAAANADGHIDAAEQRQIFDAAERSDLDAEAKAFIFDAMRNPLSPSQLAALARDREQAAELYLAARMAIDPDHPDEQRFLDTLAHALDLPDGLARHLETQVAQSLEG